MWSAGFMLTESSELCDVDNVSVFTVMLPVIHFLLEGDHSQRGRGQRQDRLTNKEKERGRQTVTERMERRGERRKKG